MAAQRWWLLSVMFLTGLSACGSDGPVQMNGGVETGTGGAGADRPDAGVTDPNAGIAVRPAAAGPVFDDTILHQVSLTMAPEDWQSILDDSRGDEWRHATLVYDGVTVPDVGIRPSGESSRYPGNPKMSIRVRFDAFPDHGKFGGIDVLKLKGNIDDSSMIRDRLSYFVYRKVMRTPREAHSRLLVNGEVRGVYSVVEIWESDALKQHFSEPLGALYRLRGVMGTDPYAYIGDELKAYVPHPWEQKLGTPSVGDDVVPKALRAVADSPAAMESAVDVDNLLSYLAANALVTNSDGLTGDTGCEDHYQYFDPASGKLFVLPWDPDATFGAGRTLPDRLIYARFSKSRLLTNVRDNTNYRKAYEAKIRALMEALPAADLAAEAVRIHDQIKDAAYEDQFKSAENHTWEWSTGYVRDFVYARYANVAAQIGL